MAISDDASATAAAGNAAKAASTATANHAKIGLSRCVTGADNRKDVSAPDDRGGMILLQRLSRSAEGLHYDLTRSLYRLRF
jgi:hypothetical protein